MALIRQAISEKKIFENDTYIHVHGPGAGADNTLGSNIHMWVWLQPWSYDLDHLYKFMSPLPKEDPHKIMSTRFQRRCLKTTLIYMNIAVVDNSLGSKVFYRHKSYVNLVICCKIFPFNDFKTVFSMQIHRRPSLTLS